MSSSSPRAETRRSVICELVIVFSVTLGASALRSLLSLIDLWTKPRPLASQTVSIVVRQATVPLIDLFKQLVSVAVGLAWGALGLYLLWRAGVELARGIGWRACGKDLLGGLGLAALIGIPGIGLYLLAHAMNLSATIAPATLDDTWWRIPVLLAQAFQNGFLEEILVVGYLMTRLQHLKVNVVAIVAISALLRGSYHLYQGPGMALGNVLMGVVFALVFLRYWRIWPLIIAHTVLDAVSFVGYSLLKPLLPWLP